MRAPPRPWPHACIHPCMAASTRIGRRSRFRRHGCSRRTLSRWLLPRRWPAAHASRGQPVRPRRARVAACATTTSSNRQPRATPRPAYRPAVFVRRAPVCSEAAVFSEAPLLLVWPRHASQSRRRPRSSQGRCAALRRRRGRAARGRAALLVSLRCRRWPRPRSRRLRLKVPRGRCVHAPSSLRAEPLRPGRWRRQPTRAPPHAAAFLLRSRALGLAIGRAISVARRGIVRRRRVKSRSPSRGCHRRSDSCTDNIGTPTPRPTPSCLLGRAWPRASRGALRER
jgi:hypothetical protein